MNGAVLASWTELYFFLFWLLHNIHSKKKKKTVEPNSTDFPVRLTGFTPPVKGLLASLCQSGERVWISWEAARLLRYLQQEKGAACGGLSG